MKFNITNFDNGFLGTLSSVTVFGGIVVAVLGILVHIVFAIAVYRDAVHLDRTRTLIIAGPMIWGIATLFGVSLQQQSIGQCITPASIQIYPSLLQKIKRMKLKFRADAFCLTTNP